MLEVMDWSNSVGVAKRFFVATKHETVTKNTRLFSFLALKASGRELIGILRDAGNMEDASLKLRAPVGER